MKKLAALFIVFIVSIAPTHDSCGQASIDSLEFRLANTQGEERLAVLADLVQAYHRNDPKKAIQYGREAKSLISEDSNSQLISSVWYHTGLAYEFHSDYDSLLTHSKHLQSLKCKNCNQSNLAHGLLLEGNYLFVKGEYHKAQKVVSAALKHFESLDNQPGIAQSLNKLADIHTQLGAYVEATSKLNKSLAIWKKNGNEIGLANTLDRLGVVFLSQGLYREAMSYLDSGLTIFRKANDHIGKANSLLHSCKVQYRQGNYDEAIALVQQALSGFKTVGYELGVSQCLTALAIVYTHQGNYVNALKHNMLSLEIQRKLEYKNGIARSLNNIGIMYIRQCKLDKALDFCSQSLSLFEEIGAKKFQATLLSNIGYLHRSLGDNNRALTYFDRSLLIREEFKDYKGYADILSYIGLIHKDEGDLIKALSSFSKSIKLAKEIGDKEGQANYLWNMSILYRMQDSLKHALDHADQALLMTQSIDALTLTRDIQKERSSIFEQMGKFDLALESHRAYKAAQDSLFNSDSQSVFAELQEQYKTKEQQQRIQLLEKDQHIKQLWLFGLIGGAILLAAFTLLAYNRYRLKTRSNIEIKRKSDELQRSNEELRNLSEFKQGMTHMIAHDIKNPLNSIIGMASRMKEKSAGKISQAGTMILQLITNMLDVEKYEHTQPEVALEKIRLSGLLAEAKLAVELLLHDKSIRLVIDLDKDCELEADHDMLLRVFVNLLSNAIKFSPSNDKIIIKATYSAVDHAQLMSLSFSDHGPGIHPEDLPHLFKKFWQSEARHSGAASSNGLGLAFCKLAIEAHNGKIWAESNLDKGSTFILNLPVLSTNDLLMKDESMIQEPIRLTKNDKKNLIKYADRLKALKVYQVSTIMEILEKLESLSLESYWLTEMKSAVYYSNKEKYEELVKML